MLHVLHGFLLGCTQFHSNFFWYELLVMFSSVTYPNCNSFHNPIDNSNSLRWKHLIDFYLKFVMSLGSKPITRSQKDYFWKRAVWWVTILHGSESNLCGLPFFSVKQFGKIIFFIKNSFILSLRHLLLSSRYF